MERAVEQSHVVPGRDDVGTVVLHHHAVGHFMHGHPRVALDDVAEDAFVIGGEVLNEDESHARITIGGQAGEERFEGGEASG